VNLHWDLDAYDNTDYFRMMELMNAKEKKDRDIDPADMLAMLTQ